MQFEIRNDRNNIAITKPALALSSISQAEIFKMFTLPQAVVLIKKDMTAEEIFTSAVSLHLLATQLISRLTKNCEKRCGGCDGSCIEQFIDDGIEKNCYELAMKYKRGSQNFSSYAYNIAEAIYSELIDKGCCMYDLFSHYVNEDIIHGE